MWSDKARAASAAARRKGTPEAHAAAAEAHRMAQGEAAPGTAAHIEHGAMMRGHLARAGGAGGAAVRGQVMVLHHEASTGAHAAARSAPPVLHDPAALHQKYVHAGLERESPGRAMLSGGPAVLREHHLATAAMHVRMAQSSEMLYDPHEAAVHRATAARQRQAAALHGHVEGSGTDG
jgi:hypothetical protein